jgi:hypothetical protein
MCPMHRGGRWLRWRITPLSQVTIRILIFGGVSRHQQNFQTGAILALQQCACSLQPPGCPCHRDIDTTAPLSTAADGCVFHSASL